FEHEGHAAFRRQRDRHSIRVSSQCLALGRDAFAFDDCCPAMLGFWRIAFAEREGTHDTGERGLTMRQFVRKLKIVHVEE
ncbi:MAG: hypothetical protein ACR2H1_13105, partial [Limisphaerales bacterium]